MTFPVFDLHCDTANELISLGDGGNSDLKSNKAHIDLDRASQLPGYAQCFACFTTTGTKRNPVDIFEKKMMAILKEIDINKKMIRQAFSAKDIEKNREEGIMSAILTIEGPAGFGFDPELLEDLYKIGFRVSSLGWNEKNPLTGSHVTGGGLTDQGRAYVKEMQRLGMIVDVSHISDEGFWDIMKITQAPILATHSNSRAVCASSRNLTDDMFRAICETGGVAGLNMYTEFVGNENASIDSLCDHVLHFLELDPSGKHIALGGDLDGCETLPRGFEGIQSYPVLARRLLERGLDEQMLMDIYWNNAIGVMERAVCNHKK